MNFTVRFTGLYKITAFLSLIFSFSAFDTAYAQTNAVLENASESETQATSKAVINPRPLPLHLSSLSMFYGPTVRDPGKHIAPDSAHNADVGLSVRNNVQLDYVIDPLTSFGPVADFSYIFTDPNSGGQAAGFLWRDSYLAFRRSNLYATNMGATLFNLNGDIRYYFPTSRSSQNNRTLGAARFTLDPVFQFGTTGFTLVTRVYSKHFVNRQSTNARGNPLTAVELYAAPQINYRISDRTSAFVLFEGVTYIKTNGNLGDDAQHLTDIQPGINFLIGKNLMVSPYFSWFPELNIRTTSMNLNVSLFYF